MRILIVFASTEGHTAKLSEFVAGRLAEAGHEVSRRGAADEQPAPGPAGFDRVLVMGSLHAGDYQRALVDYVRRHAAGLRRTPTAFISVSLSAAGHDRRDWKGLEACLARFQGITDWAPSAVHQAAGAFSFTRYGLFKRFIMSRIARQRGLKVDTKRDYDLTDYDALGVFVRAFADSAARPAA